jgi:transcriptional regulator with GAF, ATPase, and Fis domain
MSPDRTAAHAHLAEVEAEQAALRRIAALLTRSVPAEEVFDAVVDEVRLLMGVEAAGLLRYEADKTATVLAVSEERVVLPGDKLSTEGHSVFGLVLRTGRPARIDDYAKATGGEHVRRMRETGLRCAGRKRACERAGVVGAGSLARADHQRRRRGASPGHARPPR